MWRSASCSERRARAGALLLAVAIGAAPAGARVLATVEDALARAFPAPARVEKRTLYLDRRQAARIEARAGSKLPSRIATCFVARSGADAGAEIVGWACLDTHVVRTLPETVLVVVDRELHVRRVEILAFREPADYLPSDRWLAQFEGRPAGDDLALRRGIRVLSGATLSSHAITRAVRRVLAIVELELAGTEGGR